MIALAYIYAEGDCEGAPPPDLQLLYAINRFGAQAVFGRTLGAKEIKRMNASENIVNWFRERSKSQNWATWSKEHPEQARALETAARIAGEYGE